MISSRHEPKETPHPDEKSWKQREENERRVRVTVARMDEFDDLLSKVSDPLERRQLIIDGVRSGMTIHLEHVRMVMDHLEANGPLVIPECVQIAQRVGATTSSICEMEGWTGTAALLAEREGNTFRAVQMYELYVDRLEGLGRFGLAAEVSLHKLEDPYRALHDARLAGNWEIAGAISVSIGDQETAEFASRLTRLLR